MKLTPWVLLLLLLTGATASFSANDIAGNWSVEFVSGVAWKTIGGATFEFKVQGNKLDGMAHVGHGWPGTAPISEGIIDGDHISFLVVGQLPSTGGYPKMRFTGTVQGDEIQLTMTRFYSAEPDAAHAAKSDFKGRRIAK